MKVDDVVGAAFLPTDGQANPTDITMALAAVHAQAGATICEDTEVRRDRRRRRRDQGRRHVAGTHRVQRGRVLRRAMDALARSDGRRQRAAGVGRSTSTSSPRRSIRRVPRDLPTLRDPDRLTYYKEEVGGLVMGGYEPNPIPWADDGIPHDFHFKLLDADFDHFAPTMELAMGRVPALHTAGINELINGPESFTPDGNFILGEAPELKNFFVGAGFNAFGIAAGGGAGMALAEWVHRGVAPYDLWVVDIRRFGRPHQDTDWVRTRTLEAYGKHYTMAWPYEEHDSGRPCRISPLYSRLLEAGACFGEKLGWERPNWFACADRGETAHDVYSYERQNWFEAVGREHRACSRGGRADRPDVVRQVRAEGSRRARRARLDLLEQRRQAGRLADVHADARRLGWHPVRPHRLPRGHRRVLHRHRHRLRDARLRLDPAIDPSRDRTRNCSTSPRPTRCCR